MSRLTSRAERLEAVNPAVAFRHVLLASERQTKDDALAMQGLTPDDGLFFAVRLVGVKP